MGQIFPTCYVISSFVLVVWESVLKQNSSTNITGREKWNHEGWNKWPTRGLENIGAVKRVEGDERGLYELTRIVYQRETVRKAATWSVCGVSGRRRRRGLRGGREVSLPRVGQWHTHLRGEGGSLKPPLPFRRPMNESPADDFFDILPPLTSHRVQGMISLSFYCVFIPSCFSLLNINLIVETKWFFYEMIRVNHSLVLGNLYCTDFLPPAKRKTLYITSPCGFSKTKSRTRCKVLKFAYHFYYQIIITNRKNPFGLKTKFEN